MASKIKADQFETLDGSGNITLNNSVTMASTKTLPAASLTGALPAISAAALTSIPAGNLTGTVADARISTLTASKLTGALPAISGANLTGVTSTRINNNADNRVITGSGTANTLEGESTLTYDGTGIAVASNSGVAMYWAGGWTGVYLTTINKTVFSSDATSAISSTLSDRLYVGCGLANCGSL